MNNDVSRINQDELKISLDVCVCTNIRRAARSITRLYDDALQDSGVRYTQMILLIVLYENTNITVSQLAEELLMDASTVARNMRPLEKLGLIIVVKGKDRRQRLVSLSPDGVDTVLNGAKYWQAAQDKFSTALSPEAFRQHLNGIAALLQISRKA